MAVNLNLSLPKNVTCYHSFNVSCRIAGTPYHIGNLKIKDECPFKGKRIIMINRLPSYILDAYQGGYKGPR